MPLTDGNAAQVRAITDQVAQAAATEAIAAFLKVHPELATPKTEIPAALKLAGSIVAALLTLAVGSTAVWIISSVSQMQVTLARMDERQQGQTGSLDARFVNLEGRVTKLEAGKEAARAARYEAGNPTQQDISN
jgi:hypothetical protein